MGNSRKTDSELVAAWRQAKAGGMTRAEFAALHGINVKQLENIIYATNKAENYIAPQDKPRFDVVQLGTPWTLNGNWVIVGDVHVPYADYEFAARVGIAAEYHSINRLLIAGDFFSLDMLSQYQQVVMPPSWAQERDAGRAMLDMWLKSFSEIRMIQGNHDRRMQKYVAGAFDESDLLALLKSNPDKVRASNYGWCWIDSGGEKWRISHVKNYGINQLTVADQLALKYNCHVLSFHEHHLSVGWDRYKRHIIANGGCLVRVDKLPYAALDDNKAAGMALGFAVIKSGYIYLYGDDAFTNWGEIVRELNFRRKYLNSHQVSIK